MPIGWMTDIGKQSRCSGGQAYRNVCQWYIVYTKLQQVGPTITMDIVKGNLEIESSINC